MFESDWRKNDLRCVTKLYFIMYGKHIAYSLSPRAVRFRFFWNRVRFRFVRKDPAGTIQ